MFEAKLTITAPGLEAALNNLAAAISGAKMGPMTAPAATALPTGAPAAPAMPAGFPAGAPLPTSPGPQYTVDQIMQAGATLMDAGKAAELMNLLASFNVPAVTALKPEQLGAFATALRQLGAQI